MMRNDAEKLAAVERGMKICPLSHRHSDGREHTAEQECGAEYRPPLLRPECRGGRRRKEDTERTSEGRKRCGRRTLLEIRISVEAARLRTPLRGRALPENCSRSEKNCTGLCRPIPSLRISISPCALQRKDTALSMNRKHSLKRNPPASLREEMKRKIRICAGGFQSIVRLAPLLNMKRYGILSFQYISHRVLRWAVTPFLLPVLFLLNGALAADGGLFYRSLFAGQIIFYSAAFAGYLLERRDIRSGPFIAPLYFTLMNIAAYAGLVRYLRGTQSAVWEKAQRKQKGTP
jgi:hypothetical protein